MLSRKQRKITIFLILVLTFLSLKRVGIVTRVNENPSKNEASSHVMLCAIWYHLYNLKNTKNTHGAVLLLVKLQAKSSVPL